MKKTTSTPAENSSVATPSAEKTTQKTRSRAKANAQADTGATATKATKRATTKKATTETTSKKTVAKTSAKVAKTEVKTTTKTEVKTTTAKPITKRSRSKKPLSKSQVKSMPRQTLLEFVQREDGTMALQERNSDRVLVTINFGEIVKDVMGADSIPVIGHHMIQAAISHMMQEQLSRYHAQVYDEPVARFS